MAGLAALDPARDARACRARSHRRHRTHRTPTTRRSDRPNLQRDPTSLHQIDHRTHPADHRSAGLVALATTPSTPRPCQPLPPARNSAHVITIYGWSTRHTPFTALLYVTHPWSTVCLAFTGVVIVSPWRPSAPGLMTRPTFTTATSL